LAIAGEFIRGVAGRAKWRLDPGRPGSDAKGVPAGRDAHLRALGMVWARTGPPAGLAPRARDGEE
jgi:hypothetical protein